MEAFLSGIMDDSALSDDLMDDEYYLFAGEGLLHQHHDLSDDAFRLKKIPSGHLSRARRGDSDPEGFFINTMTSPMMRE
ncbi:hypothetical protein ZWY2020_057016 [Hordeum vulgare]|nr:hypothetical protein ZWY2020_057016 [Hordeum vulgare]